MFGPHNLVPPHLLSSIGKGQASALCIYYSGDTPSILISGSNLTLTDESTPYIISLTGKTSEQVAGEINQTTASYTARVLCSVPDLSLAHPTTIASDVSADGGQIIRVRGHTVRNLEDTAFKLLPPYKATRAESWYPLIERGTVKKRYNGVDWIFSVPEYETQAWSVMFGKPYIDLTKSPTTRVSSKVIKLPRTPVFWRNNNLFLYANGLPQSVSVISDVDEYNGFVYLKKNYDDDEELTVSYTYEEENYTYRGIDLNPTEFHNPAILGRYVVIYLLPSSGSVGVIRSDTVRHSEGASLLGAIHSIPKTDEPYLILGAFQVSSPFSSDDISLIDTRSRGGGIKRVKWPEALKLNKEVWSTTDAGYVDGIPYPGGSALVLTLPKALKDIFTEVEILSLVKKHAALGTNFFIEYI